MVYSIVAKSFHTHFRLVCSSFPAAPELFLLSSLSIYHHVPLRLLPKPPSDLSPLLHPIVPAQSGPALPQAQTMATYSPLYMTAAGVSRADSKLHITNCLLFPNLTAAPGREGRATLSIVTFKASFPDMFPAAPTSLQPHSSQFLKEFCGLSQAVSALSTSLLHKLLHMCQESFEMSPSRY